MPSPFPGMDPWLENSSVFPDLHDSIIMDLRTQLNALLPTGYAAISNARVYFETEPREPDVSVLGKPRVGSRRTVATLKMVGLQELNRITVGDPIEEISLDIYHADGKRLVTSIEILSRANKIGKTTGRKEYLKKQRKMIRSGVNLVEVDLLRKGRHATLAPIVQMQSELGDFDYHISVFSQLKRESIYVAPIQLADRLPQFGIPLDSDVKPVIIDLQLSLDRAYDSSRYTMFVNYSKQPQYKLTDEQFRWAKKILKSKGILKS